MCRYKGGGADGTAVRSVTGSKCVRVCVIKRKYTHDEYFMRHFFLLFFYFACDVEDHESKKYNILHTLHGADM